MRELERRGHSAIAPTMPNDDPEAGLGEYAAAVLESLAGLDPDEDLVIVGHSLGGLVAPIVAHSMPVRPLVYLTSALPKIGGTFLDAAREEPFNRNAAGPIAGQSDSEFLYVTPESIGYSMNRCDLRTLAWVAGRIRPQALSPFREVFPLDAYPDVPSSVVLAEDDRGIDVDLMSEIVRRRLGIEPVLLAGDHSIYLSATNELADYLVGLAESARTG